jgi:hypothetical protein
MPSPMRGSDGVAIENSDEFRVKAEKVFGILINVQGAEQGQVNFLVKAYVTVAMGIPFIAGRGVPHCQCSSVESKVCSRFCHGNRAFSFLGRALNSG